MLLNVHLCVLEFNRIERSLLKLIEYNLKDSIEGAVQQLII